MQFLNENYTPIPDIISNDEKLFWLYDLTKRDFFLRHYFSWHVLKSETYLLEIDHHVVRLPASFFMVIGDYDGGLDLVKPEEIVGRSFDVLTFKPDFTEDSWLLEPVRVIGYEDEHEFQIPFTNHPLPILISDTKAILVSANDVYNKIKNMSFADII